MNFLLSHERYELVEDPWGELSCDVGINHHLRPVGGDEAFTPMQNGDNPITEETNECVSL